jgi:hypothetical protein
MVSVAHAADPGATDSGAPPAAMQPSALTVSVGSNGFLNQSAALNAAVRLSDPSPWHYQPSGPALDLQTPAQTITFHYRLLPSAALSPYIGGSLITPDALAGINRGGVSLNLKNGASVAMGFDTDRNGQAKLKFDVGLQQGLTSGPTYDHKSYNPMMVGAGVGLKF